MKKWIFTILIMSIFTACNAETKQIADISEASGICYASKLDRLFVVGDEGDIYEMKKTGEIVRQKKLGRYDIEGVACDNEKGILLLAIEDKMEILLVRMHDFHLKKKISIKKKYKKKPLLGRDKKHGLEGIAIVDDRIVLSNQKHPVMLLEVEKRYDKKKLSILEVYDHRKRDISGLCYHDSLLYMVSDKKDSLYLYDLKSKKIKKEIALEKYHQEGIAVDNEGSIYITDDAGGVRKYKAETLGL